MPLSSPSSVIRASTPLSSPSSPIGDPQSFQPGQFLPFVIPEGPYRGSSLYKPAQPPWIEVCAYLRLTACRNDSMQFQTKSEYRSLQSGLLFSIRCIFHARVHFFSCFSLAIALSTDSVVSKYTRKKWHRELGQAVKWKLCYR